MGDVLGLTAPFFGLILLGYVCGRVAPRPEAGLAWMNFFIVYVALPALFFLLVSRTPVEKLTEWRFVAATTTCTIVVYGIAFAIARFVLRRDLSEAAMQGVAGSYSNIGYMGPGLTLAAFGLEAAAPTALIFAFDNMFLFTITPILMAMAGRGDRSGGSIALPILKGILTHPFILATIAGVLAAIAGFVPPAPVETMLGWLKGAAAPCALFTMGVVIALRPARGFGLELPGLLALKLLLHPLLVYVALMSAGPIDPVWVKTAVVMAALPPALNVFVLAQQYGVWVERASSMILAGTLLSVVTVSALLFVLAR